MKKIIFVLVAILGTGYVNACINGYHTELVEKRKLYAGRKLYYALLPYKPWPAYMLEDVYGEDNILETAWYNQIMVITGGVAVLIFLALLAGYYIPKK